MEVLQALADFACDQLTSIFQIIYESGNMTDRMCDSVFVALSKVEGALECSKHRTLSIMSQNTRIFLRIILKRIRTRLRPQISGKQLGFVRGKGTNNVLFSSRVLTERALEVQKEIFRVLLTTRKLLTKLACGAVQDAKRSRFRWKRPTTHEKPILEARIHSESGR